MVKLTEVEDEHFTTEKPIPTKEALLVSDNEDDEDFTDTGTSHKHSYRNIFS
jgi:import receptor subunit TOM22